MPDYPGVTVQQTAPAVALVRFSRPPHNFIEFDMIRALGDAYEQIAAQGDARVIVLASDGKNFCAGGDFSSLRDGGAAPAGPPPDRFGNEVYAEGARLVGAPLPVVAAIQGAAVGGGFGLACTADFRVGNADTRLVPAFASLGIHHGFGLTVTLPRIVGPQRAAELLLTGRRIRGDEGHRLGLLDRFVDGPDLVGAAVAFASEIATSAPLAIRAIRATLRQGLAAQFLAAAAHESHEQARLSVTEDFREGVRAAAERRPPRFTGR